MLPTAPLALVLCWWSQEMETNSKCALLGGEGGWGQKRPCVHWPQHPIFRQLGRDTPRAHLRKGTKLGSGSFICESENSPRETKLSPNASLLRKAARSGFSPRSLLAIGTRRVWAASCSLCTGALLVVAGPGNLLQTCSTSGRRRMGPEKALCALAPPPHILPARQEPS